MKCTQCGGRDFQSGTYNDALTLDGVTYRGSLKAMVCQSCGESRISDEEVSRFEERVVQAVSEGSVGPQGLQWMRKWLGLRAVALAELLDTTAESFSRWENGKHAVPVPVFWLVGQMVRDELEGRATTHESLRQRRKRLNRPQPRDVVLDLT